MLEAHKIMTTDVITIHNDAHIKDAMKLIVENKISGLPVVDGNGDLVGVITEKDMLQLLLHRDVKANQTVGALMNSKVISFGPDESIIDICKCFMDTPIRRIPIVKNHKLLGIISRRDIIELILNSQEQSDETQ